MRMTIKDRRYIKWNRLTNMFSVEGRTSRECEVEVDK